MQTWGSTVIKFLWLFFFFLHSSSQWLRFPSSSRLFLSAWSFILYLSVSDPPNILPLPLSSIFICSFTGYIRAQDSFPWVLVGGWGAGSCKKTIRCADFFPAGRCKHCRGTPNQGLVSSACLLQASTHFGDCSAPAKFTRLLPRAASDCACFCLSLKQRRKRLKWGSQWWYVMEALWILRLMGPLSHPSFAYLAHHIPATHRELSLLI